MKKHTQENLLVAPSQTRNQTVLNPFLQERCYEICDRIFPDLVASVKVPFIVALPAGIHPYNKASAYYDLKANAIVLYQASGREVLRTSRLGLLGLSIEKTVIHELAHWYQFNILKSEITSTVNVHKHVSWSLSCFEVTNRLFPGQYDLNFFKPAISKRTGKSVRKVQREGSLTWKELHHFPYHIPQFDKSILG